MKCPPYPWTGKKLVLNLKDKDFLQGQKKSLKEKGRTDRITPKTIQWSQICPFQSNNETEC